MSIRFFTDSHHAPERSPSRPYRHCEKSLPLVKKCLDTAPKSCEAVVFGGDAIQVTKDKPRAHYESLLQEFGAAARQSSVPFYAIAGNHEYDYFRDMDKLSALSGVAYGNKIVDLQDGQRLILLNDKFHSKDEKILYPFSADTLDFVRDALENSPTNKITLVTHTPIDDFDLYFTKIVLRDFEPEYSFRSNAAALREILDKSGKSCLVLSGHTHYENFSSKGNVAYLTLQSLVEGVRRAAQETTFERWADITRNTESDLHIRLHGYKGYDIVHRFPPLAPQNPLQDNQAAPLLAAE